MAAGRCAEPTADAGVHRKLSDEVRPETHGRGVATVLLNSQQLWSPA